MNFINTVSVERTENGYFIIEPAFRYHHNGEIEYDFEPMLVLSKDGMREVIDELQQALKEEP